MSPLACVTAEARGVRARMDALREEVVRHGFAIGRGWPWDVKRHLAELEVAVAEYDALILEHRGLVAEMTRVAAA